MSIRRTLLALMVPGMLWAAACDPNIPNQEPLDGGYGTNAMFDPVTGILPLPIDLLKNPVTGLLMLPPASTDSALTTEIKASMNSLDGWLTSQTVNIPFDAELDDTTVKTENVLLFDVTDPKAITQFKAADYYAIWNKIATAPTKPPYNITVKTKPPAGSAIGTMPKDWALGGKYMVVVTDAVKGKDPAKARILESQVGYFLKDKAPLIDSLGHPIALLAGNPKETNMALEATRKTYEAAWNALETGGLASRAKTAAFTQFSVQSGPRSIFNPASIGTLLPWPIDIPSKANAPLDAHPFICFDAPVKVDTIVPGIVFVKFSPPVTFAQVQFTVSFPGTPDTAACKGALKLEIIPSAPLSASSLYIIILKDSIIGANGTKTAAFPYFSLIRNKNALLTTDDKLASPLLDSTLDVLIALGNDPRTATKDQWDTANAMLISNLKGLETLRQVYNGQAGSPPIDMFTLAETFAGVPRLSNNAMWTFTTKAN